MTSPAAGSAAVEFEEDVDSKLGSWNMEKRKAVLNSLRRGGLSAGLLDEPVAVGAQLQSGGVSHVPRHAHAVAQVSDCCSSCRGVETLEKKITHIYIV